MVHIAVDAGRQRRGRAAGHRIPAGPRASGWEIDTRSLPAFVLAVALSFWATLAGALEIEPFTAEALAQAQRADAPLALHFHSESCATCRLQAKAFNAMRAEPGLEMTLLVVDFDNDRETCRAFRVFATGAVIVLRGSVERKRLMGVVDPEQLRAALRAAF